MVVSKKYGTITFSRGAVVETGMEGKWVKLFYEPTKRIIGWQTKDGGKPEELKKWKFCKAHPKTGVFVLGVKKMLDDFNGGLTKDSYLGLPVQKYREIGALDQYSGQTFYYVEVRDREAEEEATK